MTALAAPRMGCETSLLTDVRTVAAAAIRAPTWTHGTRGSGFRHWLCVRANTGLQHYAQRAAVKSTQIVDLFESAGLPQRLVAPPAARHRASPEFAGSVPATHWYAKLPDGRTAGVAERPRIPTRTNCGRLRGLKCGLGGKLRGRGSVSACRDLLLMRGRQPRPHSWPSASSAQAVTVTPRRAIYQYKRTKPRSPAVRIHRAARQAPDATRTST